MMPYPPLENCWFLVGPTAAGKSAVGAALARRLDAEILSLDSMAVYYGMDIGTAKPDAAARAAAPMHLLDLVDPTDEFSIAQYLAAAHAKVAEIRGRSRQALFVGGTPLYLKALLCGLAEGPQADPQLRQRLTDEAQQLGPAALHVRLGHLDPPSAARLHPHDTRRIVRALEFLEKTGQPISGVQQQFHRAADVPTGNRVFVLDWPRAELHRRINQRVDEMFAQGLVEEVRGLLARYSSLSQTSAQGAGYREVLDYLAGQIDLATAIERTKARTRQLARRQLTWLRGLNECRSIPCQDPLAVEELAEQIAMAEFTPGGP
ncbi:MAG: tRNA (adenosine(37)-N6)-dimethylallyltransferase MiaA [Planctomycetia bacterium]|nr:tRNA (adenosine(37)-N6)-dimethylallyltransferase MiaA [Planctomycetia bacterium]